MHPALTFILVAIPAFILLYAAWWWFIGRNQPQYPPLAIDNDDPLMQAAERKAKATLATFLELAKENPQGAMIKIRFETNGGEIEQLWAGVNAFGPDDERGLSDEQMEVLYLTPPVTHSGKLERVHKHTLDDIMDWAVEKPDGHVAGGYTQQVMFIRAREEWGELPPDLQAQEKRYDAWRGDLEEAS